MGWLRASGWSIAATVVAMGLMFLVRATLQVRTLPERVMEWVLIFVPLDAFERGIRTFGPQAKVLALYGSTAIMFAVLLALGTVMLRFRWSGVGVLGLAVALYLVTMAGVMPLTGGGVFGTQQVQHPLLVNGAYLGMALSYATVLLAGQVLRRVPAGSADGTSTLSSRRALIVAVVGSLGAYAVALRQAAIGGGAATSDLPLVQLPAQLAAGAADKAVGGQKPAVEPTKEPQPFALTVKLPSAELRANESVSLEAQIKSQVSEESRAVVRFLVNGQEVRRLFKAIPPMQAATAAYGWTAEPGRHTLRVEVTSATGERYALWEEQVRVLEG